jgi:hypothetical protein
MEVLRVVYSSAIARVVPGVRHGVGGVLSDVQAAGHPNMTNCYKNKDEISWTSIDLQSLTSEL